MADTALLKKLRLKPEQKVLLLNAPQGFAEIFPSDTPLLSETEGPADFILFFSPDKATLDKLFPVVKDRLASTGVAWAAYPKGSSKMQTDLTRDKGWDSISPSEWQFLSLISLDDKWSAFSFRLAGAEPTKVRRALRDTSSEIQPENPYIDTVNRKITLPEDLAEALSQNEKAALYYEKLSFTHRKEYVVWITEAKRTETRQKRLEQTIEKLVAGIKSPSAKTI